MNTPSQPQNFTVNYSEQDIQQVLLQQMIMQYMNEHHADKIEQMNNMINEHTYEDKKTTSKV
jgi:hypothetical protein